MRSPARVFTVAAIGLLVLATNCLCAQRIAGGLKFTAAIKSDGSMWAWGLNENGQLGDGTLAERLSPAQIAAGSAWAAVAAGASHTVAIRSDGTLWAWGLNSNGQVGDGTTADRDVPVQIGSATNWRSLAAGGDHTVGLRTDGTLWTWGSNSNGQLGDGTTVDRLNPTQIGVAGTWTAVAAGASHTLAIRSDGTLWAWGLNGSGQLGDATTVNRTSPVQTGSATDWSQVAAGGDHSIAVDSDGNLWTWGLNSSGQLGDATTTNRLSPIEVASGFSAPPTVTSTSPANGATNVSDRATVRVTFSQAMDAASITTDTFFVTGGVGVIGTITYDATTNTATFTPSNTLANSTKYTATVTTGVKDASGINLASDFTWTFTTEERRVSGHCFIATAAYGSYLDPHVAILRDFRDKYLFTSNVGRAFVRCYYRFSPPFARIIGGHQALRLATRLFLTPLVYGMAHPLASGLLLLVLSCVGGCAAFSAGRQKSRE